MHTTLSQTPPELVSDIITSGIMLTGGGSLISGCEKLLQRETGLSVTLAEDAVACVAKGTGMALSVTEYINR